MVEQIRVAGDPKRKAVNQDEGWESPYEWVDTSDEGLEIPNETL